MPRQPDFYDPQVGDSEAMQIRGLQVQIGGTYVLLDDVVTALRLYAETLEAPFSESVHGAVTWLQGGTPPLPIPEPQEVLEQIVHGAEADDVTLDVERVEIFPDAEGKWYARSIDTGGNIIKRTAGSHDKPFVLRNAEERWPGIPLYEVQDAMGDSMWAERGRKGPSPKRLWAGVNG